MPTEYAAQILQLRLPGQDDLKNESERCSADPITQKGDRGGERQSGLDRTSDPELEEIFSRVRRACVRGSGDEQDRSQPPRCGNGTPFLPPRRCRVGWRQILKLQRDQFSVANKRQIPKRKEIPYVPKNKRRVRACSAEERAAERTGYTRTESRRPATGSTGRSAHLCNRGLAFERSV
jgi:hypothetical protein